LGEHYPNTEGVVKSGIAINHYSAFLFIMCNFPARACLNQSNKNIKLMKKTLRKKLWILSILLLLSYTNTNAQAFALDTLYGNSGKIFTYINCVSSTLLNNNKLIVASGLSANFGIRSPTFGIIKYNDTGSIDSTFGVAGKALYTPTNINDRFDFYRTTTQTDGKIITVGQTYTIGGFVYYYNFILTRFHPNGVIDTTFGYKGLVNYSLNSDYSLRERFTAITIDSRGRILVAGYSEDDTTEKADAVAMRFLSNGAVDTTFANKGVLKLDVAGADEFTQIKTLADNSILLTGYNTVATGNQDLMVVKLTENGIFDTTFGTNGRTNIDFGAYYEYVSNVFIKPNNKIVVVGFSGTGISFTQLDGNGRLDATFSGDGKNIVSIRVPSHYSLGTDYAYGGIQTSILPNNQYLIFSSTKRNDNTSNTYDLVVTRINENSTLDVTFGANGVFLYETIAESKYAYNMHFQSDGKVLLMTQGLNNSSLYFGNVFRYLHQYSPNVGIKDLSPDQNDIKIFPNPFVEALEIKATKAIQKIDIYNLDGKKIKTVHPPINQIDLSNLINGFYMLKIYCNSEIIFKKVIKQ
jgi:uncharacterized delta-60 repeat protein